METYIEICALCVDIGGWVGNFAAKHLFQQIMLFLQHGECMQGEYYTIGTLTIL